YENRPLFYRLPEAMGRLLMAGCSRSEETVKTLTTKKSPRRSRCPAPSTGPMTTAGGAIPA
ncbi:hypothetical protein, partial [Sutterella wadsworthensis]|uniref:hypothetical protein n=1 Tax=Sutterella wadsworthensis TaxID=40545 RepID=UPI003967AD95